MSSSKIISASIPLTPSAEVSTAPVQRNGNADNLLKAKANGIAKDVLAQIPAEAVHLKAKTWSILEKLSALGLAISQVFSWLFSCFTTKKTLAPPLPPSPSISLKESHSFDSTSTTAMLPIESSIEKNIKETISRIDVSTTPLLEEVVSPTGVKDLLDYESRLKEVGAQRNLPGSILQLSRQPIQGIPNRGNACYRNSVFQALRTFPDFRAKLRAPIARPERPRLRLGETDASLAARIYDYERIVEEIPLREPVRLALVKLLTSLENAENTPSASHALEIGEAELELRDIIFNRLRPVMLDGSPTSQQDAADYLSIVLKDVLGMTLDFETTRRIPSGSQRSEVDSVGALRIAPRNVDLQALVSELFAESEGSEWNFENKRQPTYIQSSKIKGEPPSFIPLHVGRLQYSQLLGEKFRNEVALKIPKNGIVDLSSGFINPKGPCLYSIASFVVHLGSANGGHYIGYVKRADGWYECNDNLVSRVPDEKALGLQANAYILMLAKVS